MIIIESKRKKPAAIMRNYPDAILADVTSSAKDGLVELSSLNIHGLFLVLPSRILMKLIAVVGHCNVGL